MLRCKKTNLFFSEMLCIQYYVVPWKLFFEADAADSWKERVEFEQLPPQETCCYFNLWYTKTFWLFGVTLFQALNPKKYTRPWNDFRVWWEMIDHENSHIYRTTCNMTYSSHFHSKKMIIKNHIHPVNVHSVGRDQVLGRVAGAIKYAAGGPQGDGKWTT